MAQQGQGLVEHWDGSAWSLIADSMPRPFASLSGGARDPTVHGAVWVVGATGPALTSHGQLTDTHTLTETNR